MNILAKALENNVIPENQAVLIYRNNFEELVTSPCIRNMEKYTQNNIYIKLPSQLKMLNGKYKVVLPLPEKKSAESAQRALPNIQNVRIPEELKINQEQEK